MNEFYKISKLDLENIASAIREKGYPISSDITGSEIASAIRCLNANPYDSRTFTPNISRVTNDVVQDIREMCFYSCKELYYVSMKNAKTIGIRAFDNCSNIQYISLPKCETIGNMAFECNKIEKVDMPCCITIGVSAFFANYQLSYVNLPHCATIETSAFNQCSNISYVNISNVKVVGTYAFSGCKNIPELEFFNLNVISNYAFYQCSKLSKITMHMSYVPQCGTGVLNTTPFLNSTYIGHFGSIYVPQSLIEQYKVAAGWQSVSNRFAPIETEHDVFSIGISSYSCIANSPWQTWINDSILNSDSYSIVNAQSYIGRNVYVIGKESEGTLSYISQMEAFKPAVYIDTPIIPNFSYSISTITL